jgi:hypothetical protein
MKKGRGHPREDGPFDVARHVEFRGERVGKIIRFCGKIFPKTRKMFP